MPSANNSELRRCLQEITDMKGISDDQREMKIVKLASTHPHSIRRLEVVTDHPYNCFEYAFELVGSFRYRLIAEIDEGLKLDTYVAGSEFAHFLIKSAVLKEIKKDEIRSDHVVVYLDINGTPQHAGKIVTLDGRIKSKWGGGLFLEHGLWEVPERYGNTVTFYRSIRAGQAEQTFLKFVKSRDGGEEFINDYQLRDLFPVCRKRGECNND